MTNIDSFTISTPSNLDSSNSFSLVQTNSYYNPYSIVIGMKAYVIHNILFFADNEVKASTGRGWFGSNNNIRIIIFKTKKDISRKTKMNLSTDSPFIIKSSCDFDTEYDLYIPVSDLPKFEISYKKTSIGIEKYTDIGLPNPSENYIRELVKFFKKGSNVKEELREAIKSLADYDIERKSDEEFNTNIQNIIKLHQKMRNAYEVDKNYSVEDYKRENNIN